MGTVSLKIKYDIGSVAHLLVKKEIWGQVLQYNKGYVILAT